MKIDKIFKWCIYLYIIVFCCRRFGSFDYEKIEKDRIKRNAEIVKLEKELVVEENRNRTLRHYQIMNQAIDRYNQHNQRVGGSSEYIKPYDPNEYIY